MYKLYAGKGAGSAAIEALLLELKAKHERIDVVKEGSRNPDWFFKINPRGEIPTLELPDGQVMTESAAIMIYLADQFPDAGLAPATTSPQRAAYLRWMVYFAANAYTSDLRMYYPERFSINAGHADDIKAKAIIDLNRDFDVFVSDMGKGPFITGDKMSAADIYAAMLICWSEDVQALLKRQPSLARYYAAVTANPSVRAVWARNELYLAA
jgi:glutathione S-transferase